MKSMEFAGPDFRRALDIALMAVERRNAIPVLDSVLVRNGAGTSLIGTNLDMEIAASLGGQGSSDAFLLPHPRQFRAMSGAAGGDVSVRYDPNKGRLSASAGGVQSDMAVPAVMADFPRIGLPDAATHPEFGVTVGQDFLRALARVAPASSVEETRYYLNGVYFHHVKGWTYALVTTNGHHLYRTFVQLPQVEGKLTPLILPNQLVDRLLRLSKWIGNAPLDIRMFGDARIRVRTSCGSAEVEIIGKLIDGKFPAYERAMPPAEGLRHASFEQADLLRAIRAVSAMAYERTRAVKLTFVPGGALVSLDSPEIGQTKVEIAGSHNFSGGAVAFNRDYLQGVFAGIGGSQIRLSSVGAGANREEADSAAPVLFRNPDDQGFEAVIMPIRA